MIKINRLCAMFNLIALLLLNSSANGAPILKRFYNSSNSMTVCSWNISFLGHWKTKNVAEVSNLIQECDVVFIQELVAPFEERSRGILTIDSDPEALSFFESMKEVGFDAHHLAQQDTGSIDFSASSASEWPVVFFKSSEFKLESGYYLNPETVDNPRYRRVPYLFELIYKTGMKYRFVSLHLSVDSKTARDQEMEALCDDLSYEDQTLMTIVLGDFNHASTTEFQQAQKNLSKLKAPCRHLGFVTSLVDEKVFTNVANDKPFDNVLLPLVYSPADLKRGLLTKPLQLIRDSLELAKRNEFTAMYSDHKPIAVVIPDNQPSQALREITGNLDSMIQSLDQVVPVGAQEINSITVELASLESMARDRAACIEDIPDLVMSPDCHLAREQLNRNFNETEYKIKKSVYLVELVKKAQPRFEALSYMVNLYNFGPTAEEATALTEKIGLIQERISSVNLSNSNRVSRLLPRLEPIEKALHGFRYYISKASVENNAFCTYEKAQVFPRYDNEIIRLAASKLRRVAFTDQTSIQISSLLFYPESIGRIYQDQVPSTSEYPRHVDLFLRYLCGEFKDNPGEIGAKLEWINHMHWLEDAPSSETSDELWTQVNKNTYNALLVYSAERTRAIQMASSGKIQVPLRQRTFVPPMSICETKMAISRIQSDLSYNFDTYEEDLASFGQEHCKPEDHNYVYIYRGDSNLKPNSGESNAMIWISQFISNVCDFATLSSKSRFVSNQLCETYHQSPVQFRKRMARYTLATWLLYDKSHIVSFGDHGSQQIENIFDYTMPSFPVSLLINGQNSIIASQFRDMINVSDFGLTSLREEAQGQTEEVLWRLKNAIDRHDDWYLSGFSAPTLNRKQAFSPFVAASTDIAASDFFTSPGFTLQTDLNPSYCVKHFMFVYKVAKTKVRSYDDLSQGGASIDFSQDWLDSPTLGSSAFGGREMSVVRMAAPNPGEYEAILNLSSLPNNRLATDPELASYCTFYLGNNL